MRIRFAIHQALLSLRDRGELFESEKWQGIKAPQKMFELLHLDFNVQLECTVDNAAMECQPNLPWADLHFAERVGGVPSNPGGTYHVWPFWRGGHLDDNETFTHTYQQRLWTDPLRGQKFSYGNLGDVVELLRKEPTTRQAFIPVWFPEDTGAVHGGRVPCTIGYHVIIRNGRLDIRYYLRSCDARRHFNDDLYLCNRLALWINEQLGNKYEMGLMCMNITNFHVFESDLYWLTKQLQNVRNTL